MNLFEAVFGHDLNAPAVVFGGREISYGELRLATLQMAHAITSLGVQRGDRVALLLHDSPEFVEAFIATCSLGAIAVPINMALRLDEQCSILHNCGATIALRLARAAGGVKDESGLGVVRRGKCEGFWPLIPWQRRNRDDVFQRTQFFWRMCRQGTAQIGLSKGYCCTTVVKD